MMGDCSAKVGADNRDRMCIMGEMNDNGERLCEFASTNGMVTTRTLFLHKLRGPQGNVDITRWENRIPDISRTGTGTYDVIRAVYKTDDASDHLSEDKMRLKLKKVR